MILVKSQVLQSRLVLISDNNKSDCSPQIAWDPHPAENSQVLGSVQIKKSKETKHTNQNLYRVQTY